MPHSRQIQIMGTPALTEQDSLGEGARILGSAGCRPTRFPDAPEKRSPGGSGADTRSAAVEWQGAFWSFVTAGAPERRRVLQRVSGRVPIYQMAPGDRVDFAGKTAWHALR